MKEADTVTADTAEDLWDRERSAAEEPEAPEPEVDAELADVEPEPDHIDAPDEDPASPPETETDPKDQPEGSADEVEDTPEPEVEAEAPDTEEAPTDGPPTSDEPEPQPFSAKADGQVIEIPDAKVVGDKIEMPVASWQKAVQPYLADRTVWRQKERDYQAKLQEKGESEVKAETILTHFSDLLEKGPDAVYAWLNDFEKNKPALEARVENAALKSKLESREQREKAQTQEERTRAYEQWKPGALKGAIESALKLDNFKDADLDQELLYEKLNAFGDQMFFEAEEDIPQWGVKKGQVAPRYDLIFKAVHSDAQMARKLRDRLTEAQKAKKANHAATKGANTPPTVKAKGSPTPSGKQTPKPQSYDEWVESLNE